MSSSGRAVLLAGLCICCACPPFWHQLPFTIRSLLKCLFLQGTFIGFPDGVTPSRWAVSQLPLLFKAFN